MPRVPCGTRCRRPNASAAPAHRLRPRTPTRARCSANTVPIYHESRLAKLDLKDADDDAFDSEVDELTEEGGDAANVARLRRWAALRA